MQSYPIISPSNTVSMYSGSYDSGFRIGNYNTGYFGSQHKPADYSSFRVKPASIEKYEH